MSDSSNKKKPSVFPLKTIREGAIAASVWKRQAPSGYVYFDFSLSRSWKAQSTGKEGYSSNFFANNEQQLLSVVAQASAWITEELAKQPDQGKRTTAEDTTKRAA